MDTQSPIHPLCDTWTVGIYVYLPGLYRVAIDVTAGWTLDTQTHYTPILSALSVDKVGFKG